MGVSLVCCCLLWVSLLMFPLPAFVGGLTASLLVVCSRFFHTDKSKQAVPAHSARACALVSSVCCTTAMADAAPFCATVGNPPYCNTKKPPGLICEPAAGSGDCELALYCKLTTCWRRAFPGSSSWEAQHGGVHQGGFGQQYMPFCDSLQISQLRCNVHF